MENYSLLLIFWYGILHAFGPDHLTAIADFSIGKDKRKTMLITIAFAIGHGLSLFIFAKILEQFNIRDELLGYGDLISSAVIIAMGVYLLYLVFTDKIHLSKHTHNGKEHIHIYFGKKHTHNETVQRSSAFTMGLLMGAGGVRGMLVTLGAIEAGSVDYKLVFAFTLGVMLVFVSFGLVISYINKNFLNSKQNVRRVFATAGVVSLIVGSNMLFASNGHSHSHFGMDANVAHTHTNITNTKELLASKKKSNMTYKQMMMQMGEGFKMIQTGLLTQNKELISLGCNIIQNHPAPKTKPWLIMPDKYQDDFKETLISYDKILHSNVAKIQDSLKNSDFTDINKNVFELSNSCISCHSVWQNRAIK